MWLLSTAAQLGYMPSPEWLAEAYGVLSQRLDQPVDGSGLAPELLARAVCAMAALGVVDLDLLPRCVSRLEGVCDQLAGPTAVACLEALARVPLKAQAPSALDALLAAAERLAASPGGVALAARGLEALPCLASPPGGPAATPLAAAVFARSSDVSADDLVPAVAAAGRLGVELPQAAASALSARLVTLLPSLSAAQLCACLAALPQLLPAEGALAGAAHGRLATLAAAMPAPELVRVLAALVPLPQRPPQELLASCHEALKAQLPVADSADLAEALQLMGRVDGLPG